MTDLSMHGRTCNKSISGHRPGNGRVRAAAGPARPDLLDAKTEVDLIVRWRDHGDPQALHQIMESYQRLVTKIAARYRASGLPMEDLVSEGNVGLMHAIGRFEPERGFRLSTYAMWWIRAAISDHALNASSAVKVVCSDRQKRVFFALRRTKARLSGLARERLSDEDLAELAEDLDVPQAEVAEVYGWMEGHDLSINVAAGTDSDNGDEWQDFVSDDAADPEEAAMARDESIKLRALVAQALETLDVRERQILIARQLTDEPSKLATLGERYGVSRERVRQIEARALQKLRRRVRDVAQKQGIIGSDKS